MATPIEDMLYNAPGRPYIKSRDKNGNPKGIIMPDGRPLRWPDLQSAPNLKQALGNTTFNSVNVVQFILGNAGLLFSAPDLRGFGMEGFLTGDYHIPTTLMGGQISAAKFKTEELPQQWTGPRDLDHICFVSCEADALPVFHYWHEPANYWDNVAAVTPPPTSSGSLDCQPASVIDREISRLSTEDDEPQDKIRLLPDITHQDQEWQSKLIEFQDLLADYAQNGRRRPLLGLMKEIFLESQIRRLTAYGDTSRLAVLQRRDTILYFDALQKGAFQGVYNNSATKFTMVYFGLPVEPLTVINIEQAGKNQNDAPEKLNPDYSLLSRSYAVESDLEFLDMYHERAYGYPCLRSKHFHSIWPSLYKNQLTIPRKSSISAVQSHSQGNV